MQAEFGGGRSRKSADLRRNRGALVGKARARRSLIATAAGTGISSEQVQELVLGTYSTYLIKHPSWYHTHTSKPVPSPFP